MSWTENAACRGMSQDVFYPEDGSRYPVARRVCADCPVRQQCLNEALEMETYHARYGMFGGMSPNERDDEHRRRKAAGTLVRRRAAFAQCGTPAGYLRHLRRKETPCDSCVTSRSIAHASRQGRAAFGNRTADIYSSMVLIASRRELYAEDTA